jgi:hypothetical protein
VGRGASHQSQVGLPCWLLRDSLSSSVTVSQGRFSNSILRPDTSFELLLYSGDFHELAEDWAHKGRGCCNSTNVTFITNMVK